MAENHNHGRAKYELGFGRVYTPEENKAVRRMLDSGKVVTGEELKQQKIEEAKKRAAEKKRVAEELERQRELTAEHKKTKERTDRADRHTRIKPFLECLRGERAFYKDAKNRGILELERTYLENEENEYFLTPELEEYFIGIQNLQTETAMVMESLTSEDCAYLSCFFDSGTMGAFYNPSKTSEKTRFKRVKNRVISSMFPKHEGIRSLAKIMLEERLITDWAIGQPDAEEIVRREYLALDIKYN